VNKTQKTNNIVKLNQRWSFSSRVTRG